MDINDLRGLATLTFTIAFLGVCWWAYSKKRTKDFNEAALLPFADDLDSLDAAKNKSEKAQ